MRGFQPSDFISPEEYPEMDNIMIKFFPD